ncbi:MAG TPA: cyclase family protein [Planctomycetaceae bacterium]|nr:cyclase family protein [Planctomycetaceae bacterium]
MTVRRLLLCLVLLAAVGIFRALTTSASLAGNETGPPTAAKSLTLDQLCSGKLRIVDLTYTLNDKSPYWPGDDYEPFKLKTIATLEKNGVLSKAFFCPEHLGTHLDAPNHFEANQLAVHELKAENLFAVGIVIDISAQAGADADYQLSLRDIADWEREYGRIPDGAIVFARTGWGRFWTNYPRYKNQDVMGKLHFPGYSPDAARLLVKERLAKGLGIDTLSMDPGLSKDFQVHHIVNSAGRFGLENVANLDELPARGFYVTVAPIKIETGSGGPTRIFAVLSK